MRISQEIHEFWNVSNGRKSEDHVTQHLSIISASYCLRASGIAPHFVNQILPKLQTVQRLDSDRKTAGFVFLFLSWATPPAAAASPLKLRSLQTVLSSIIPVPLPPPQLWLLHPSAGPGLITTYLLPLPGLIGDSCCCQSLGRLPSRLFSNGPNTSATICLPLLSSIKRHGAPQNLNA